jgi:hypothetical protein
MAPAVGLFAMRQPRCRYGRNRGATVRQVRWWSLGTASNREQEMASGINLDDTSETG